MTQDGCNEDAERDSVGQVGDTRQPGLDPSAVHRCNPSQVWSQGEDKPFLPGFILASLPVLGIRWIRNGRSPGSGSDYGFRIHDRIRKKYYDPYCFIKDSKKYQVLQMFVINTTYLYRVRAVLSPDF